MINKVLIVEDDPMARQLFTMFVNNSTNYQLVAQINNADMADIYCSKGGIDLIIMDIRTSMHASGLEASKRIKKKYPKIKIIIVTSMPEASYLKRASDIGVEAFWYKEVTEENFIDVMDRVVNGEIIFPDSSPIITLGNATSNELTSRELEVLKEIIKGSSNLEISQKLFVTERTVKAHIQNLLDKTGFKNRTELAVEASNSGIVSNY